MMKHQGFTLFELLITLLIMALILGLGLPSFSQQIQKNRVQAAAEELRQAVEAARTQAVMLNKRTLLQANESWHNGWTLFIDLNNDGNLGSDEPIIREGGPLEGIKIRGNSSVKEYISFIPTGEGRKAGRADGGAFITGTLTICPDKPGDGYKLVLSRGGRLRSQPINKTDCAKNS